MKRGGTQKMLELHGDLAIALQGQFRGCRRSLKQCRRHFSPGEVHALRVRIRRLLSLVELPASFLKPGPIEEARRRLKKKLDLFGDLRDTQVQQIHLKGLLRLHPAARLYRDHLRRWEEKAVRKAARQAGRLRNHRLRQALDQLRDAVVCRGREGRQAEDLRAVSVAMRKAYSEAVRIQSKDGSGNTAAIHRTRIAFKRYRYMAEALTAWSTAPTTGMRRKLRAFQTLLGNIQDAQVLLHGAQQFARKQRIPALQSRPFLKELEGRLQRSIESYLASRGMLRTLAPDLLGLKLSL